MTTPYDPRLAIRGSGHPVVLVPGMDGTGNLFYRQVPLLARSYRVATYALRDTASEMDTLVADLAAVVDVAAPAPGHAILIGESFGGALALSFALAHPGRVSALVIVNSFPFFPSQHRLHLAIGALQMVPWGAMGLFRRLTAFRMHSRFTHRAEIRRFLTLTKATTRRGYLNRLRVLTRYDVRTRLAEIRCPTLFVAAELDHLVSARHGEFMAAHVPGAELEILAGHGHICLIAPDVDLERMLAHWAARGARRRDSPVFRGTTATSLADEP